MQVPARVAGFPADSRSSRTRQIALCDFLTRSFGRAVSSAGAGADLPFHASLFQQCPGVYCKLRKYSLYSLQPDKLGHLCIVAFAYT